MMKRLPIILLAITVAALAVLITTLSPPSASAQVCGPGSGWVDPCPAGDDDFPTSGAVVGIDFDGDCVQDQSLVLSGPTTIQRQASVPDTIDTEIISMSLEGGGFTLNAGASTVNPNVLPSLGEIVEQVGDDTLADSFFDVYFEVLTTGDPLYNHSALKVEAVIDQVPPFDTDYLHPIALCIDLFDDPLAGSDTGFNLVEAVHDTGPDPIISGGGIAKPIVLGADSPAETSASGATRDYTAPIAAAAVAAALLTVAAGGWYVRRRLS